MSKVKCIGLIAEDNSDFETAKILITRILNKDNLSFKKAVGNGCGKLRRKALQYVIDLKKRGCDMVIFIHDLDRNIHRDLYKELKKKIESAPVDKKFICIPVEEMEAWFLGDPDGIKNTFNLARRPRFNGQPETINSPKETLGEQVYLCSNKSTIFLNTKHNQKIAERICIETIKEKCPSFEQLHTFVTAYEYR
jgi:hypothetical protein